MVTGSNQMCYLLNSTTLSVEAEINIQGTVTTSFCSDALHNNLFFGLQENFSLKLMSAGGTEIVQQGAHSAPITCLEFTQFNNLDILFSGSEDGNLKAWQIDRGNG